MKILYGKSGTMKEANIQGEIECLIDVYVEPLRTDIYLTISQYGKDDEVFEKRSFINWDKFLPYKVAEWIATKQLNSFINEVNEKIVEKRLTGKILSL